MCGNVKSLSQPGIRDSLLNFHKKWYSSNIMTLSVIGKFELAQLETWVTEKFSPVVNKEVVLPDLSEPKPYPVSHLSKFISFFPVKDEDKMTLLYFLPYCQKDHKT
jgi:insulysin